MIELYNFFIDNGAVGLERGILKVSENVPAVAAAQLRRLGWALRVEFVQLSPAALLQKVRSFFTAEQLGERACLIDFSAEKVWIFASEPAGCFCAVQIIIDLLHQGYHHAFVMAASPRGESGIKLYLPPPTEEGVADFKRIIDFAAFCRCSFVMLELGGALEYKSHPEINSAWVNYCRIMNEYPGKTLDVQNNSPWRKNSIHSENGGGRVLSQSQFLQLTRYCRERFLEVIPEMPSLSHSDYILAAHPELAERSDDPFPDACCPLNEAYQQIYNDLLEEVINLVKPERINICHDELYSVGLCPRCKTLDPAKLYADDINRIAAFLRSKNVKTVIWGEKLLNSHWQNGEPIGGAAVPAQPGKEAVPALYPALEHITGPLEIMHWYWTVDRRLDEVYAQKKLPYYFANLSPAMFKDWQKRISAPLAMGTCISNWGQTSWRTLQRNGVLYDLLYTSFLMWNAQLGEEDFEALDQAVFDGLYRWNKFSAPLTAKVLEVTHTVKSDMVFKYFFDGFLLDESTYLLGNHIFADDKGKMYSLPVIFGSNISRDDVFRKRSADPEGLRDAWVYNLQHTEVACECIKTVFGGRVWYTCCYPIDAGAENLSYIKFEPAPGSSVKAEILNFKLI